MDTFDMNSLGDESSLKEDLYKDYLLNNYFINDSNQSTNSLHQNDIEVNFLNENNANLGPPTENIQKIFQYSSQDDEIINQTPDLNSEKINFCSQTRREDKIKTDCTNNKKKCGRKTDKTETTIIHDKFFGDNIIRKIKVHVIQEKVISMVNNNLTSKKKGKKKLLKLYQKDLTCLKKDKNIEFMQTKLKDIFKSHQIGDKYLEKKGKYNEKLIDEIYRDDEFIELQKLLDLTFMEFFDIYTLSVTKKVLDENLLKKKENIALFNSEKFEEIEVYFNKLAEKNKKKGISDEESNEYIETFKKYCRNYKEWFVKKVGRNKKE